MNNKIKYKFAPTSNFQGEIILKKRTRERVEELGRRRPTGSDKTEVETGSHSPWRD